jgi:ABC-type nitrate/sulfonate/bicarbonate transport system substrate-binding protein
VQGAVVLSTTDTTGIDAGVLVFSKKVLDTQLDSVKAFYRAYYKAAVQINADPDACRDYLVGQGGFPVELRDVYRFVSYRKPGLPDDVQIRRALDWLKARNLLNAELTHQTMCDSRAISEW